MSKPSYPIGEAVNYPSPTQATSPTFWSSASIRKQISLNGRGEVGVRIVDGESNLVDAVGIYLEVYDEEGTLLNAYGTAKRESLGVYSETLGPEVTYEKRTLTVRWHYVTEDEDWMQYEEKIYVVEPMPLYESLTDGERYVVEQVTWLFGDLFDSTEGGAFLTEAFQSHFTYERLAQLMQIAIQKINMKGQPLTSYFVGPQAPGMSGRFPEKYYGILVLATYLEVLRHLIRSYVEIPEFRNMSTTYTDRRDYLSRWKGVLDEEKPLLDESIALMKRELMNLGRGALLVAGGIYGGSGKSAFFQYGMYSSQLRATRFYPAIPSMVGFQRG